MNHTATPQLPLDGRVAVVTGAFGNLGPIWVRALHAAGARVTAIDLRPPGADDALPEGVDVLVADVTDPPSVARAAAAVEERAGVPHVLVNNAGIDLAPTAGSGGGGIEDVDPADVLRVLHTNTAGVFTVTQAFGVPMAAAGRGSIINIGSLYAAIAPDPSFYDHMDPPFLKPPAYGASKMGVIALTRYFARLWGPANVRVNALSPGGVDGGQDPEFRRKFLARTPLRRFATEPDLAPSLVYLASDASAYLTGQDLRLDGGFTA